jgi:hypothetical protein
LGQNDTVPAVPVPAPVPQHWFQLSQYFFGSLFWQVLEDSGTRLDTNHRVSLALTNMKNH